MFTTVHLPAYSVKRGESFKLMMTVCNYMDDDVSVHLDVSFDPEDFDEMTDSSNPCTKDVKPSLTTGECRLVNCPVKSRRVGEPEITVTVADSNNKNYVHDIFVKKVKVKVSCFSMFCEFASIFRNIITFFKTYRISYHTVKRF